MSALLKYVGGPKDGVMEHRKGVPDHLTFETGVYWLKTFKGRNAVMVWESSEKDHPTPVLGPEIVDF